MTEEPTTVEEDVPKTTKRVTKRRIGAVLLAILCLLVLGAGGAAYATLDYSNDYEGRILPGSRIAGVKVGGMSRAEAVDAVEDAVRPDLERTITVRFEKRTWETSPLELGATSDAEDVVDRALQASRGPSFIEMARMRLLGHDLGFEEDVAIDHPAKGVGGFVEGIAAGFDRKPRDAEIDYSSGWVEIRKEQQGRKVLVKRSRSALMQALREGAAEVDLAVKTTTPKTTRDDFHQILLLRIGENKLYLYEDGKIQREWTVATGQPEYPTPTGIYEVTLKRYMPTWVNPDPEGWGADMPESIPPGPGNPLGVRAINWSAPAIRFHGTSAIYSLGYNASHGCVRMSNADVIELYDIVEVGTPIVSTVVAPLKPMYVSAPDPTVVDDDGERKPESSDDDSSEDAGSGSSKKKKDNA